MGERNGSGRGREWVRGNCVNERERERVSVRKNGRER